MANKNPQPVHTDDGRTKEPNGSLADALKPGSGWDPRRDGRIGGPSVQDTDQRRGRK